MIASNYRRHPDAMALQLVLAFGRCTWHTSRPTTRMGRAIRAERSRLAKQTPQIVRWVARSVPSWWKDAQRAAKALARQVRAAMLALVWDCDANDDLQADVDPVTRLFEEASSMTCEYLYHPNPLSSRINNPNWLPTWHHTVHGGGRIIHADYRD